MKADEATITEHARRSHVLAQAMVDCAAQHGWTAGELVAAIPMATAVVTPVNLLDQVCDLMQIMCNGRKAGAGVPVGRA